MTAMRKHLSNRWVLVGVAAVALVASALISYLTSKWHWFGRSGAIVTLLGVLLSVRPLVRMGLIEWVKEQSVIDGGHVPPTPEEVEEKRQTKLGATATQIGAAMAVVGTLIWAYGDLIGGLP
jgi:hypothetical protein